MRASYLVAKVAYEEAYPCVAVDEKYCDFSSTQHHNLFGWGVLAEGRLRAVRARQTRPKGPVPERCHDKLQNTVLEHLAKVAALGKSQLNTGPSVMLGLQTRF